MPAADRRTAEHWVWVRRFLNGNRPRLARSAANLYPEAQRVGRSHLLARESWVAAAPMPLERVALDWNPDSPEPVVTGAEVESDSVRPLQDGGSRYPTYAAAVGNLARPGIFEGRPAYRLLGVDGAAHLRIGRGSYFSTIDTCEAVAHEFAAWHIASDGAPTAMAELPFRGLIGDPLDPTRRTMVAAVTTLTLRQGPSGTASFVLHRRDPTQVATGGGMFQVAPVGVFQPSGPSPEAEQRDLDLWRSIAREYSEEFLGAAEHQEVNYATWPFFGALTEWRARGACRPYYLGLGVDPLSLVTDILTVVVFDSTAFDDLFAGLVARNSEGDTIAGVAFDAATVSRFVEAEPMQPAGAAVLDLAWRHREAILGTR